MAKMFEINSCCSCSKYSSDNFEYGILMLLLTYWKIFQIIWRYSGVENDTMRVLVLNII